MATSASASSAPTRAPPSTLSVNEFTVDEALDGGEHGALRGLVEVGADARRAWAEHSSHVAACAPVAVLDIDA